MPEEFPPPPPGPAFDKIQNFNFLLSRTDPAAKAARHYSIDADTGLVPFANMDYDQTEGMGGLSVSSYDSIDDDRGSLDLRGYPYHDLQVRFTSILSFQARAPPSQDDRGAVRIEDEITVPKRVDSEHAIPQANDNLQDKPANLLPNCSYSAMAACGFSICS
ncbi:hypothetical protein PoHVEF18_001801 [Penicillium ochrochloron]